MKERIRQLLREQEEPQTPQKPSRLEKIKSYLLKKTFTVFDDVQFRFTHILSIPVDDTRRNNRELILAVPQPLDPDYSWEYGGLNDIKTHFEEYFKKYFNQDVYFDCLESPENFEKIKSFLTGGPMKFTLKFDVEDLPRYIDSGRDYRDEVLTKYFSDDMYDDWYGGDYSQWEYYVDHLNEKNLARVKQHLKYVLSNLSEEELEDQGYDSIEEALNEDLETLIKNFSDEFDELTTLMDRCIDDGDRDDYAEHVRKTIISDLEDYGDVTFKWDEGFTIEIDLAKFNIHKRDLIDYAERCDYDPSCIFYEALDNDIDKPTFGLDDRYQPSCEYDVFNDYFSDAVYELDGVE